MHTQRKHDAAQSGTESTQWGHYFYHPLSSSPALLTSICEWSSVPKQTEALQVCVLSRSWRCSAAPDHHLLFFCFFWLLFFKFLPLSSAKLKL